MLENGKINSEIGKELESTQVFTLSHAQVLINTKTNHFAKYSILVIVF